MSKKIIIITGKMGTGKTELANALVKHYGDNSEIISFAKPLKDLTIPLITEYYENQGLDFTKIPKKSYRSVLQLVGEAFRELDQDYWLNKHKEKVNSSNKEYIIIDDCRFENEYNFYKNNAITFKRSRPSIYEPSNHPSETGLDHKKDEEYDLIVTSVEHQIEDIINKIETSTKKL